MKRVRKGQKLLAAAVASVGLVSLDLPCAQGSVVVDLRATRINGSLVADPKNVSAAFGDVINFAVVVRISGTNATATVGNFDGSAPDTDTHNDDSFQALVGAFNSVGALKGNFDPTNSGAGQIFPWNGAGSQNGIAQDFDSDGDLDLGAVGTDPTNMWAVRANSRQFMTVSNSGTSTRLGCSSGTTFTQDVGGPNAHVPESRYIDATTAEMIVSELSWTVTSGSGSASLNFIANANSSAAGLWFEDGISTGKHPDNSPFGDGAPVTVTLVPTSLYWDGNGASAGAGAAPSGTWGTSAFWTASSVGNTATTAYGGSSGTTVAFSAGGDAVTPFTVTVSGTQSARGLVFEEGTVTLTGGTVNLRDGTIDVASGTSATVNSVIAGTSGVIKSGAGTLSLGGNNTATGNVSVLGGTLNVTAGALNAGNLTVDASGGSTVNQTGGVVSASGVVRVGSSASFAGSYSLILGALNNFGAIIGDSGAGTFIQSGGIHSVGSPVTGANLSLGNSNGASGRYNLSASSTLAVYGNEFVGAHGTGSGTFIQTGGVHTVGVSSTGELDIARDPSTTGTYTLSGTGSLTVNGSAHVGGNSGGAGGTATLNVQGGDMSVSGTLKVWNNGTLNFSGGTMTNSDVALVGGGRVNLIAGTSRVLRTSTLSVDATSKLDVGDNKMIVKTTPIGSYNGTVYTGITGMIQAGRNGNILPLWDGAGGIITSQTNAMFGNRTTIGIARGSEVKSQTVSVTATWAGQTITGTDTLVMYTYGGDANLDGKVNIDDYIRTDLGIAGHLSGWSNGDFNYDGQVNIDDYTTVIDSTIGSQGPPFPTAGGVDESSAAAVPEPGAGFALLGALAQLRWRRCVQRRR